MTINLLSVQDAAYVFGGSKERASFEQELVTDLIELITVFSARTDGTRSNKALRAMTVARATLQ